MKKLKYTLLLGLPLIAFIYVISQQYHIPFINVFNPQSTFKTIVQINNNIKNYKQALINFRLACQSLKSLNGEYDNTIRSLIDLIAIQEEYLIPSTKREIKIDLVYTLLIYDEVQYLLLNGLDGLQQDQYNFLKAFNDFTSSVEYLLVKTDRYAINIKA